MEKYLEEIEKAFSNSLKEGKLEQALDVLDTIEFPEGEGEKDETLAFLSSKYRKLVLAYQQRTQKLLSDYEIMRIGRRNEVIGLMNRVTYLQREKDRAKKKF